MNARRHDNRTTGANASRAESSDNLMASAAQAAAGVVPAAEQMSSTPVRDARSTWILRLMEDDGEAPGQCGTKGAAQMAKDAGVDKLVLVHMGPHIAQHGPLEKGLGDIREIFPGQVVYAEELMKLEL